jgi:hypothetical protein
MVDSKDKVYVDNDLYLKKLKPLEFAIVVLANMARPLRSGVIRREK